MSLSAEAKPFVPGGGSGSSSSPTGGSGGGGGGGGGGGAPPFRGPRSPAQTSPTGMPDLGGQNIPLYSRAPGSGGGYPHSHHHSHQQPPRFPPAGFASHQPHYQQHTMHMGQPRPPMPHVHGGGYNSPTTMHPHHSAHGGSPVPEQRPYFVMVLGSPFSGKTSVSEQLAKKGDLTYIQNDESLSGYRKLESELKSGTSTKGYVLDDFIGPCQEEVHYLLPLLAKYRYSLDSVVYLDMNVGEAMVRAQAEEMLPTTMAQHASHYDVCVEHFEKLIIRPLDVDKRPAEDIADEILKDLKSNPSQSKEKLTIQDPSFHACAKFVADYSVFAEVRTEITDLLGQWKDALAEPGVTLDYAQFVRRNYQLRRYTVSASVEGDRILLMKRGSDVYLIPSRLYGMYQLDAASVPPCFQTQDDFVVDGIACKLKNEKGPAIFISDVLHAANLAKDATREERMVCLKQILEGITSNSMFLSLPTFPIHQVETLVRKEWLFPGNGLIFSPPGGYKGGLDPRMYSFPFTDAPVVFRVWESKEVTLDTVFQPPRGPKVLGWAFQALCIYPNNEEGMYMDGDNNPTQVQVPGDMAEKYSVNDGNLLEFARVVPEKGKGPHSRTAGTGYWKFIRRVDSRLAHPSLVDHVATVQQPDWTKDTLVAACTSMHPVGAISSPTSPHQ